MFLHELAKVFRRSERAAAGTESPGAGCISRHEIGVGERRGFTVGSKERQEEEKGLEEHFYDERE